VTSIADRSAPSPAPARTAPAGGVSLLWRVFGANIVVAVLAVALLAWTPVTVHRVATPRELVVLAIGLAIMLGIDLALLRRTFSPLRRLADVMGAVRPGEPGRRAPDLHRAGREVEALGAALNEMLERLERERRESGRMALAAQEAERRRIARELHDEIGQTLTAIALRAEVAAQAPGGAPASSQTVLAEIAQIAQRSLADVQRIGRELRPEALDDLGLVDALIVLCANARAASITVRPDLDRDLPPLGPDVELVVYRVAQEALTNALRHSGAGQIIVALHRHGDGVRLSVSDDGHGLPRNLRESGLRGMRERAMLIEAELDVRTTPHGTEIVLQV
jgi:two-component system sensor histidine kinase UhpB